LQLNFTGIGLQPLDLLFAGIRLPNANSIQVFASTPGPDMSYLATYLYRSIQAY